MMRLWRTRKKPTKSPGKSLSLEKLEDRAMLASHSIVSGHVTSFVDADGTQVHVKLSGPGQGTLELVGGVLTGAAIDTLELTGTTGASKLKISTRGGTIKGTTINDLAIEKALGESGALKHLKAKKLYFNDGGQLTADGDVDRLYVRGLGEGATVDVDGNVAKFKTHSLGEGAALDVSGTLQKFVAHLLETGSAISAEQLDMLKVKQQAAGANVDVGVGGLVRAKLKNTYASNIASDGNIGKIVFRGDTMGVNVVSNIDAGSDGVYGTIDDFVIDRAMAGNIQEIKFRGQIGANGSSNEVDIVASGQVGQVSMSRRAHDSGGAPAMWEDAAQSIFPLSIVQSVSSATGYADDQVWIAVYGTESGSGSKAGNNYYLDYQDVMAGIPVLQQTSPTPSSTTPNMPIVPSFTLADWKAATQTWGSNLAFPVPREGNQWSGRILISVGAPVQAQINGNGTVAAPDASNPTDPSAGTFYDFLEFTVSGKVKQQDGTTTPANLDIDTSLVDEFGIPMSLQLFQQNPGVTTFTGTLTAGSNTITGVTSTTGLAQGQSLVGANIPLGATITTVGTTSVTMSMNAGPAASGSESIMAVDWSSFAVQIAGTIDPNSNIITGVDSTALNNLILHSNVGTAQPILATNVLPEGTTIESYVIGTPGQQDSTITLTRNSLNSVTPDSSVTFTINPAGPVGVEADRQTITSNTSTDGLAQFLLQQIANGTTQARPFLQSSAPFVANGPAVVYGASSSAAPIIITAPGTGNLVAGNVVQIDGVLGNTAANGIFEVASPGPNSFTLGSPVANGAYTNGGTWTSITPYSVSNASDSSGEVMITAPTTGLSNGDTVVVVGVVGNTGANGTFTVSNVTASSFVLSGSTNAGTYAYGGYWYQQPTSTTPITGASGGAITIDTASTGALAANDFVLISGVGGNTAANGLFQVGTVTPNTSFELAAPLASGGYQSEGTWTLAITDTSTTQATITTASTAGLNNGDVATISGVDGNDSVNGEFLVGNVTLTTFDLTAPVGNGAYTSGGYWSVPNPTTTQIYSATNTGPIVITTQNTTGLADGDTVLVSGVAGNTAANGNFTISNVTANSFTLDGSTGNAAYISGGTWQELQPITAATGAGTAITVTSGSTAGLAVGQVVEIQGVAGNTAANGLFVVAGLSPTTITLGSPASTSAYIATTGAWFGNNGGSGTVTDASRGGAIVVTTANTVGLANDDLVEVSGIQGNSAANSVFYVADVTPTSFTLQGSLVGGNYASGGTWKQYAPLTRLISPKDLTELLGSPQDAGALNNYYNELIDEFFLKYYDGTINGQTGGGQTLQLFSSAYKPLTYSGTVQQVTINNANSELQYSGYALQLKDSTNTDPTTYNIIYPFFTTNAPAPDVYSPVFDTAAPPTWLVSNTQQFESASQMMLACDAVFADNTERVGIDIPAAANGYNPSAVLGDLENSISAAFNRGIAMNDANTWSDSTQWFPSGGTYNYWVKYWHQDGLTFNDLAYAFSYDDRFGASTNLQIADVGLTQIILGQWSQTLASSTTSVTTSAGSSAVNQNSSQSFTATVTGTTSPTGTVTFFLNGLPVNSANDSTLAPIETVALTSNTATTSTATLTANLPTLPGGNYTYTVTAVYSGDGAYLPSIGTTTIQIS